MNTFTRIAVVAALAIVATGANAQSFSDVYGRDLTSDAGTITINANGTMDGVFNGQELQGRWWTDGGNFCREGSLGGVAYGPACQTISMGGGRISFTTVDGNRTTTYRIQ